MQKKISQNENVIKVDFSKNAEKKTSNDYIHDGASNSFHTYLAQILLKALKYKDNYTYEHSLRVAFFSLQLGKQAKLDEQELYELELGALFHDIGKIGIPDNILLKPQRLEQVEFEKMSQHPTYSEEILKLYPRFQMASKIVRHHHERYDGKGYPDGLKGEDIPLASRIVLIADTFDAMISDRPYRKGLSYDVAFEELEEFSGSQFDAKLVSYFIKALRTGEQTVSSQILPNLQFKRTA